MPDFQRFSRGSLGYDTDWNNLAPNIGVAWRPNVQSGFLRRDPRRSGAGDVRAGFSVDLQPGRHAASSPSSTARTRAARSALSRTVENGSGLPGRPVSPDAEPRSAVPRSRSRRRRAIRSPCEPNRADDLSIFHPDIQVALGADAGRSGLQRALSANMAVEVRYVGTRGVNQWSEENWNEDYTIVENGFYDEFQRAMGNLQANNAAGGARATRSRYFGAGTGTSPLPIYLAYLNGSARRRTTPAPTPAATGRTRRSSAVSCASTRTRTGAAADLDDNATRRASGQSAGLPPNLFVLNRARRRRVRVSKRLATITRSSSRCGGGCRAASRSTAAISTRSRRARRSSASTTAASCDPRRDVRHAFKMQWDWSDADRPRPALRHRHATVARRRRRRLGILRRGPLPDAHRGLR